MQKSSNSPPDVPTDDAPTGCIGKLFAVFGVIVSGVWLLNFTFGIAEDSLPIVGNLDEALATTILIYCLSRLGMNTSWLTRNRPKTVRTIENSTDKE